MNWMVKWAGPYPLFLESARAPTRPAPTATTTSTCASATPGRWPATAPRPSIAAVERQLRRGITHDAPDGGRGWVGEELTRRFGLPLWQFTMTATDANRFSLRLARAITGRPFVAVHEYCYHGSVDETFAVLADGGRVVARRGNIGPQVDPAATTRVVPFNDLDALDAGPRRPPGRGAAHRAGADERRHRPARSPATSRASARSRAATGRSSSTTRPTRSARAPAA